MRLARRAALASLLALVAIGLPGLGASGSSGPASFRPYSSERYSFEGTLPAGWQRARDRLVPRLLSPREILSVGTAPMPVGGGGNCGREPVAAIRRMQPGDALITIQEYEVTARMRRHLTRAFPPKSRVVYLRGSLSRETIPFGEAGRAFEALVYFAGPAIPGRRRQAESILASLRFRAG
jgi:hypothetical protein